MGDDDIVCDHFYDDVTPIEKVTSSGEGHEFDGWDYFSPLVVKDKVGDANVSQEVQSAVGGGGANVSQEGIGVAQCGDGGSEGRELLEALKDVENHFLKSYECGLELSKLLEFNNGVGPSLDHIDPKECSERLIPSIAWHKSTITRSPSCRSLLSSSSRNSFSLTEINSNSDIFDETGGMESGSHLSTLGRLCAWEKKLYDEVKAGYEIKKIYYRKSSQLSNENGSKKSGIEDEVNDLYSRLLVSMKICDSISKRIEKVRDDELLPQLIELLRGLTKTWKVMLESHKLQSRTMFGVKTFTCAVLTNDGSRHLATLQLEAEIQNWRTCFSSYIASTEAYIEALSEWAYRTIGPEHEFDTPPLVFTMCRNWLTVIKNLPDNVVTYSMKRFAKDLRTLWFHQEMEQRQKRKVDQLVAESGKKLVSFEREERNIVKSRPLNVKNKVDVLAEKKAQLESFRRMVETEKAKHNECVEETRRVILVGFQTGFSSVFDSLAEFSDVCVRKYGHVAQNATLRPNLIHGR
nr:nitrate regulatory gene2 protein-like [Tanacetum cinerariifolium]